MVRSALILALLAALATPVRAEEDAVRKELAGLAADVAKVLTKREQKAIAVGTFANKGRLPGAFGAEIQRILIAEFAKLRVATDPDAAIEISGDYRPASENESDPRQTMTFVRINATLVNVKSGHQLADITALSVAAYGNDDLLTATGATTALRPNDDAGARNKAIAEALAKPQTSVANSLVKSSAASPFAVELLVVGKANDPDPAVGREAKLEKGLAFVALEKTDIYRVRVHNAAEFDVAVRLSIDGLDQFVFADEEFRTNGKPRFEYMVVPRKGSAVIKGWFRNLGRADSFLVTEYAKGAAAQLNAAPGQVGQIAVAFHGAFDDEAERLEFDGKLPDGRKSADMATGRGGPVDVKLTPVPKIITACRDHVSIRYTK